MPDPVAPAPALPPPVVDPRGRLKPSLVRLAIAPVTLVVCAALFYALRWPMPGVVAVALVALLGSIWIGPLVDRSRAALDRDLLKLLAAGRPRDLLPRVAKAGLFGWLGAPGEIAEREGRAHRATGDHARALAAYRRALAGYEGARAPLSVVAGLGHAAYECGDVGLASAALEAAHRAAPDLPEITPRLAHLALLRDEDPSDVELPRESDGETARLVLALAALRAGDAAPGRAALAEISDDGTAAWARARADVARALGRVAKSGGGKRKKKR